MGALFLRLIGSHSCRLQFKAMQLDLDSCKMHAAKYMQDLRIKVRPDRVQTGPGSRLLIMYVLNINCHQATRRSTWWTSMKACMKRLPARMGNRWAKPNTCTAKEAFAEVRHQPRHIPFQFVVKLMRINTTSKSPQNNINTNSSIASSINPSRTPCY